MLHFFRTFILAFVILSNTAVFGQGFRFGLGAGLVIAPEWGKIEITGSGETVNFLENFQTPLGMQAFLDATYAQLRIGYLFGGNRDLFSQNPGTAKRDLSGIFDYSVLDLTLIGKYPFRIGAVTLSPGVGVSYTMFTRLFFPEDADTYGPMSGKSIKDAIKSLQDGTDEGSRNADSATVLYQVSNRWWISAGLDVELPIVRGFFLQPSVLAQYGFATSIESSFKNFTIDSGTDSYSQSNFRLQTSLSVGYRF